MTNRYVIDGLLRDLVFSEKDIIVVGPTWDAVLKDIFEPVADRLQGNTGAWGRLIERIARPSGVVVTRAGNFLEVRTAKSHHGIEGSRADVWVLYQIRTLDSRDPDEYRAAIRVHNIVSREALRNNAEIIEIN